MEATIAKEERQPATRRRSSVDPHVARCWEQYRQDHDPAARNALLENYLPIVRYNAERIAARLPDEVELDDLLSAGVFGLMDAIEAFDPHRGVKFETYCAPRIRGAILDELRGMDWVPRLVRHKSHQLTRARQELEQNLGRAPTQSELAERFGVSYREFDRMMRDATAVSQVSLSRQFNDNDSGKDVFEIDVIVDKRGRNPVVESQKRDLKALLTRGMSRAERLILILYYYEEMTMKEIGATLSLSESRVSQMHSSIMERLQSQWGRRAREIEQYAEA
ncbi:MAG: FliA/WhiG family RNA polymerase sigma factor [Phycisphaerae bacterium]|nr:FliA/WhiG family RNA polymerase sigma factor [Phycisphaerae bacterium]